MWAEETVALANAVQRCIVHSGMPPGVLCRVVQELHECLTSMVQSGNMLHLEMLDVAEKESVAPASEGRAPLPISRVEQVRCIVSTSSRPLP